MGLGFGFGVLGCAFWVWSLAVSGCAGFLGVWLLMRVCLGCYEIWFVDLMFVGLHAACFVVGCGSRCGVGNLWFGFCVGDVAFGGLGVFQSGLSFVGFGFMVVIV